MGLGEDAQKVLNAWYDFALCGRSALRFFVTVHGLSIRRVYTLLFVLL